MDHAFPDPPARDAPPGPPLRGWLCATQHGADGAYRDLLSWTAARGRDRGAAEAEVRHALMLLDRLRHTYDPKRCPLRWIDGILDAAHSACARRA